MDIAPKGLLRYYILELVSRKPMAGSEIINEIREESGGLWSPSPGSVYPLLSWLRNKRYIKDIQSDDTNTRKYTLTEMGLKLLEEQRRIKLSMMKSWRFFAPHFLDFVPFKTYSNERRELFKELKNLMQAFFSLDAELRDKDNKEYVESATTILKEASLRLEELRKKIEMKSDE